MVYKAELKWCIKCNKNIKIITNKRNYINHTNNNQNRKKNRDTDFTLYPYNFIWNHVEPNLHNAHLIPSESDKALKVYIVAFSLSVSLAS